MPGAGSTFTVVLPVDQREEVIAINFGDGGASSARKETIHA